MMAQVIGSRAQLHSHQTQIRLRVGLGLLCGILGLQAIIWNSLGENAPRRWLQISSSQPNAGPTVEVRKTRNGAQRINAGQ
jgi:hypothetical protein